MDWSELAMNYGKAFGGAVGGGTNAGGNPFLVSEGGSGGGMGGLGGLMGGAGDLPGLQGLMALAQLVNAAPGIQMLQQMMGGGQQGQPAQFRDPNQGPTMPFDESQMTVPGVNDQRGTLGAGGQGEQMAQRAWQGRQSGWRNPRDAQFAQDFMNTMEPPPFDSGF